jgi:hypothetical protein
MRQIYGPLFRDILVPLSLSGNKSGCLLLLQQNCDRNYNTAIQKDYLFILAKEFRRDLAALLSFMATSYSSH